MTTYPELEIGLHKREADEYSVELRFSEPESEVDIRPIASGTPAILIDFELLKELSLDPLAYGNLLWKTLFSDPQIKSTFAKAVGSAASKQLSLRVRLFVGPSAPALNNLRWEMMRDPEDNVSLLTNENVIFSRYLSSYDWRPVRLRPQQALRALVVIANPQGLETYRLGERKLAPIDVKGELERAKAGLGSMSYVALSSGGSANLNNICSHLRDGYDIFYLVCHGALVNCEPWILLEDDNGNVARTKGSELVERLRELQQNPRLVVLASCQSSGTGLDARSDDEGIMAALGPRLSEAGIPAVLAMQGNISMQTAAIFMPVFFKELQRDGQIDRAMSVARGYVRSKPDWWVPVLFMRLKSGRIWYSPGFAGETPFKKWESLLERIDSGRCTPILGSGLLEWIFGSTREIAQQWAERYHFPMESYYREYLPQVSQFLAVSQDDEEYPYRELGKYLRGEIMRRFKDDLPDEARSFKLDQLIETTAMKRWERNPVEPHNILAQLPFSIYITTNPDNLLSKALMRAAKNPRSEICRWNERLSNLPTTEDSEPDYYPDFKNPLIFHLFGRLNEQDPQIELDSLVLTEDDYFDYLIGVTKYKKMIPPAVQSALTNTALLFLGFKMDDWNFRVFFRSIMSQGGSQLRRKYTHVAVQIDPEESRILEPERARSFLESYFGGAQISIYWGSVEDFMSELNRRRKGDDV